MDPSKQQEIDLFHDVLEQPPAERAGYIDGQHASDPQLAARLRALLAAHEKAQGSNEDTSAFARARGVDPITQTPEWVGPYRVLELIGEGGMGVVYAAEQTEPIRRRVAVKVIKLGMDTKEVIARFEAERQALAMLDHPGIAKVLDAGATETGRPYFVMELVKGLPLTEYCEKHKLSVRDVLRLFEQVCDGVQHAHHKGIIHRDLKPSNVLVAASEGSPSPKIIDFGVAKAVTSRLSERTLFTEQGRLIGTPEYMSPEQAEMSSMDVDTRTDVYSLGVMLYELLTGVLPFDSGTLRSGGFDELRRTIREVDPPRPSERLAQLARDPRQGWVDPAPRARIVRGELDWIVMRAMNKDRTRRYRTAGSLGDDLARYLSDQPVIAGPPSTVYVLRKFVKRHRYVTAVMASALVTIVAGVTGLTIGLVNARQAQALAQKRADNAEAAADFLEQVLFQADPEFGGRTRSLREVIEAAEQSIEEELGDYPEVEASVRESIGVAHRRRSEFNKAAPHLRESLEIRRNLFGDESLATAASFIAMANLRFEHEGSIDDALAMLDNALNAVVVHGLTDTLAEAWLQLDIGLVNLAGDRIPQAERAFTKSRQLLTEYRGAEHPDVSRPVRGLAMVALARHDLVSAEQLARLAVNLCDGEDAEYIGARARMVLVQVLLAGDNLEEVADVLAVIKDQLDHTVGTRHIRVAEYDACLSELYLQHQEYVNAEKVATECEDMRRALLDKNHWAILEARMLHQRALIGLGQAESAENELREISEAVERQLGPDHPLAILVAEARVECSLALGDTDLADIREKRVVELKARRSNRL